MIFNEFSWWFVAYALIVTHITILTVTIYLHRCVSHRALTVAKPLEHFFRFWCWFTTGQSTQEWAAVHRKHHAYCEKEGDPHSPKIYGFWTVLFKGVSLYHKEARNPETIKRYGHHTPNDWLENNLYKKHTFAGLLALLLINLVVFGFHGLWIYVMQIIWMPLWAAGIINGLAHHKGYKNFHTQDDSRNILPWGIIIGGEELHNNHHAYASSAKLSVRWYEFDIGWMWIKILSYLKLAKINKVHSLPLIDKTNTQLNNESIEMFLSHRYLVWRIFNKYSNKDVIQHMQLLKKQDSTLNNYSLKSLKEAFYEYSHSLSESQKDIVNKLCKNEHLNKVYEMKEGLLKLWNDRFITTQQLHDNLKNWCDEAIKSEMNSLSKFAQHLIWLRSGKVLG